MLEKVNLARTYNYYKKNLTSIKKYNKNPIINNNINFTSNEIEDIQRIQILYNIIRSITTDYSTRLGANYNQKTGKIDFKLASKNATDVILCIFDKPKNENPKYNIRMKKKEGSNIWETSLPLEKIDVCKPVYYGYRVFGPNWRYSDDYFKDNASGFVSLYDNDGNRFNPNKLAYDPYARELSHLPSDNPNGEDAFITSMDNYKEDNATYAPKSVFQFSQETIIPRTTLRPLTQEIIGEVHIKDLSVYENVEGPGTYLGAMNTAKKLKEMGFTMIEFLPLNEFDDKQGGKNYWGYMPLGYFALAKKYAHSKSAGAALREFREMIKEFHRNDIKVCMDVVYNHTGEAEIVDNNPEKSRQTSYSLIDNQTYYKQKSGIYNENSGCNNDFNTAQEEVMNLIADSIAYWASQGVDAFRFDLAAALLDSNTDNYVNYEANKSLVGKLTKMLEERQVRVIEPNESGDGIYLMAEPWTCSGENCYQLGKFPSNWAEWNDVARETYKRDSFFQNAQSPKALRNVLEGSPMILNGDNKSVNYIYSHDGFNLRDSNTYQDSDMWHFATNYNNDEKRQENAIKKQIALLLLSKGIPMLQVGDVIGHTKKGNHNSYDKDDETNYLNFSKIEVPNSIEQKIYDFSTKMIQFRKDHPIITTSIKDCKIEYYNKEGGLIDPNDSEYWDNPNSNFLNYRIFNTENKGDLYIASSSCENETTITLPEPKIGKKWYLVCDTSKTHPFKQKNVDDSYVQSAHSLLIFEEK